MSTILFFCLSVVAVQVLVSADGMLALARSPELDAAIRSNTLKDFAVQQTVDERERRRLQMPESEEPALSLTYFSVYDEFVTANKTTLGETSGSRGVIYANQAKEEGLLENHVEGALQGSCSLVSSDGKQLCSFEFFFMNPADNSLGTVVATGTVKNEVDSNSILIIEATGDDFIEYNTGMVIIKYTAIGAQTVMDFVLEMK
eukprot:CAMPEP_0116146006 /NCGR_PEP_ID=MMETSP0329-20121206/16926_1 /TAXON_ID=697910 /ORGANISM="Pseudo-nitzschia arenysensis, Strain B593" /LENGTH=201 /DNA_ID=CAMNT_0003641709 /DNA_START=85 /DNA_END=690 /DNA_ORIENTATION=+